MSRLKEKIPDLDEIDSEIIKDFSSTRNLNERTTGLYSIILRKYVLLNQVSFHELLEEAETEEDEGIPWRKRTLRRRLINFRQHLYETIMPSTAASQFSHILTLYKDFEIELQPLPRMSHKQLDETVTQFKDLPTKETIKKALQLTNNLIRALILFECSSGCATIESLNLTVNDVVKSVSEYTNETDIYKVIDELGGRDDIVPTFELKRPKTGKVFHTFCTPEAFQYICYYLSTREDLKETDKVFDINQVYLCLSFNKINDIMGLGRTPTNNFCRFRSHMLRKFHASALYNDGLGIEYVNELQGKAKNKTDSVYFMEDPQKLKQKYMEHMGAVTINDEVTTLTVKSKEYISLENKLSAKEKEYSSLQDRISSIEEALNGSMSSSELDIVDKYI